MNKILLIYSASNYHFLRMCTSGPGINNIKAELPNSPTNSEIKEIKYWKKIRQLLKSMKKFWRIIIKLNQKLLMT